MRRIAVNICFVMTTVALCCTESYGADQPKDPQPSAAGVSNTTLPSPPLPAIDRTTALRPIDQWVTSEVKYVDARSQYAEYQPAWDPMTVEWVVPFDSSATTLSPFRYAAVESAPSAYSRLNQVGLRPDTFHRWLKRRLPNQKPSQRRPPHRRRTS